MSQFSNKSVLITGHTGFKGSWMTYWLKQQGANVTGLSLPEWPTDPSLFEQLNLQDQINHRAGDIREIEPISAAINESQPDFIFHLAAQALVRESYKTPRETFETNVMGTVNLLDATRQLTKPCVVVIVTTDKCYENKEWIHSYRENDPMGGYDPYSASKGCAELVVSAYRRSFFNTNSPVAIASARAGNVIGGGDWADDRIVPDCLKAIMAGESIGVRNKLATRPWQHVLEPISGYLKLAETIAHAAEKSDQTRLDSLCGGFNFGPALEANRTVAELAEKLTSLLGGKWHDGSDPNAPHEASRLNLAIDKAWHQLSWRPTWNFDRTIESIASWHTKTQSGESAAQVMEEQIADFTTSSPDLSPQDVGLT